MYGVLRNSLQFIHNARVMSSHSKAEVPESISRFLLAAEKPIIKSCSPGTEHTSCGNPNASLSIPKHMPTNAFSSYTAKHVDALLFFKSLDKVPVHARQDVLSHDHIDIRGVDTSAFLTSISRNRKGEGFPILVRNDFFSLKYAPPGHDILRYRKSNVAYIVSFRGGCKLNSKLLQTALDKYRGKYRLNAFFSKAYEPLGTAFGRARNRRLIKKCLFESLHRHAKLAQQVKLVLGLFIFNSSVVPRSDKDSTTIRDDIDRAVRQVVSEKVKYTQQIPKVDTNTITKLMRRNVRLGKIKFPGQAPRLPFYRS